MSNLNDRIVVVFVISNLEHGGAQRQLIELVNNMNKTKYDAYIVSLSDHLQLINLLDTPERLFIIKKRHKYDICIVFHLAKLLRKLSTDIIQSYLFDAEITARLAGFLARVPLIISSERNSNYVFKRQQFIALKLTSSIPDLCIANSDAGANFNSRILKIPISKYRVVHNGVDTQRRFRPTNSSVIRNEIGLRYNDFVVGMFGSFKIQKNHPMFFKAARLVLKKHPKTRFLLVGDQLSGGLHGSEAHKEEINHLVNELGIRSNCLFLGNRNDLEQLYCACDITILPSYYEGTPNVALESMACGIPVIATDVSDNSYVIPHDHAGLIVKLDDYEDLAHKIINLIEDNEKLKTLKTNCRSWTEDEFSIKRFVEKTENIFITELSNK